jgi:hypothetical protein
MEMKVAQVVLFVERSVQMLPFECGEIEIDGKIR